MASSPALMRAINHARVRTFVQLIVRFIFLVLATRRRDTAACFIFSPAIIKILSPSAVWIGSATATLRSPVPALYRCVHRPACALDRSTPSDRSLLLHFYLSKNCCPTAQPLHRHSSLP